MNQSSNEMDEYLHDLIELLRPTPALDSDVAAQERANFICQVQNLHWVVSSKPKERHIEWIDKIKQIFTRKEGYSMLSTLLSLVLAFSFLLGGLGASIYAAQASQPDQSLYIIKTLSEQIHLYSEVSSHERLHLLLEFTDRRMFEISRLHDAGKPIPSHVSEMFQEELNQALQVCAGMDNLSMMKELEKIRLRAETQSLIMSTWMKGETGQINPAIEQLQDRLRQQARLAALGETDPDVFRLQIHDRDRLKMQLQTSIPTQSQLTGQTPAVTPVGENNRYGPGPFVTQPAVAPNDYNYGSGLRQTDAGSGGYGPGLQIGTSTCTPALDGTGPGPGPQPTSSSSGGKGSLKPTITPEPSNGFGMGSQATPQGGSNPGGSQPTTAPRNGSRP